MRLFWLFVKLVKGYEIMLTAYIDNGSDRFTKLAEFDNPICATDWFHMSKNVVRCRVRWRYKQDAPEYVKSAVDKGLYDIN